MKRRPDWWGWLAALLPAMTACGVILAVAHGCGYPMPLFQAVA